jgi:hypothetical protein
MTLVDGVSASYRVPQYGLSSSLLFFTVISGEVTPGVSFWSLPYEALNCIKCPSSHIIYIHTYILCIYHIKKPSTSGQGNWGKNTWVYPKVTGLAAWSENCIWYSSL